MKLEDVNRSITQMAYRAIRELGDRAALPKDILLHNVVPYLDVDDPPNTLAITDGLYEVMCTHGLYADFDFKHGRDPEDDEDNNSFSTIGFQQSYFRDYRRSRYTPIELDKELGKYFDVEMQRQGKSWEHFIILIHRSAQLWFVSIRDQFLRDAEGVRYDFSLCRQYIIDYYKKLTDYGCEKLFCRYVLNCMIDALVDTTSKCREWELLKPEYEKKHLELFYLCSNGQEGIDGGTPECRLYNRLCKKYADRCFVTFDSFGYSPLTSVQLLYEIYNDYIWG